MSIGTNKVGSYERHFNEDLVTLELACTTTFSHAYRRGFERLRKEAEERGAGLWSVCREVAVP
jgi:inner membrane protein